MAVTGVFDNLDMRITRAGSPANTDISNVGTGDNQMKQRPVTSTFTSGSEADFPNDSTLPRDSDNQLGDQDMQSRYRGQLRYANPYIPQASGIDIHGRYIDSISTRVVTYATDEAANDSKVDGGEWRYRRSNTITNQDYSPPT